MDFSSSIVVDVVAPPPQELVHVTGMIFVSLSTVCSRLTLAGGDNDMRLAVVLSLFVFFGGAMVCLFFVVV